MNINIDKKAESYIKAKSNDLSIHLGIKRVGSGWCVSYEPFVKMGEPFEKQSFNHYLVGDINVYIPIEMKARNKKISIGHNKFLWIQSLNVDGIMV